MVSFSSFRAVGGTPIYLQIQNFIRRGCIAGTIQNGDELPSRRVLSALLGVNPYNQPGVESYKRNMFALLGKPGYEAQREELLKRL